MVTDVGGSYLVCDTDSMAIVASQRGGLFPCKGGPHRMSDGTGAVKALSWKQSRGIVDRFTTLNPYDPAIVPGSILNIVEDINRDSAGGQRQIYDFGISAKRYALYANNDSRVKLIKSSEHGLGLYYRPKEGRDSNCDMALWIKEGWEWIVNRALGLPWRDPDWFRLRVMRRIAISTPNVMKALRKLDRDKSRPYNFALSPVLVNLTGAPVTLLAPFEKDPSRWVTMSHINTHDGTTHTLDNPTLPLLVQTFQMVFQQYHRHPESKSLGPRWNSLQGRQRGIAQAIPGHRYRFHLIGKETERGWEQNDDISTLMPSLVRYGLDSGIADERLRKRLLEIPLTFLERETGLSRHTIVRARRGQVSPSRLPWRIRLVHAQRPPRQRLRSDGQLGNYRSKDENGRSQRCRQEISRCGAF